MRFSSLGSGSEGNAWLFECHAGPKPSRLLVDCGFAVKEAVARLDRVGVAPSLIDALVVTHEHGDHIGGVFKFSRRFDTPVVLTHGTWRAALRSGLATADYLASGLVRLIDSEEPFEVGSMRLQPFPVPHDAAQPVQLLIQSSNGFTAGILTDCGSITPHMLSHLKKAQALVLESNHCPIRLAESPYPGSLKRRVGGDYGHLSNETACEILTHLKDEALGFAVAAHLSKTTNCPEQVRTMWSAVLAPAGIPFQIACQENGLDWIDLRQGIQSGVSV